MYSCKDVYDTKVQRVPSPSQGNSPLSSEHWYINEFDSWLQAVPVADVKPSIVISPTTPSPQSNMVEVGFCLSTQNFINSKFQQQSNPPSISVSAPSPASSCASESSTLYELSPPSSQELRIKTEPPDFYSPPSSYEITSCRMIKTEESLSCPLTPEKMEEVQTLAMEQAWKDIETGCKILKISPIPLDWTVGDVRSWIQWTLMQYGIHNHSLENFAMDGITLCNLTEEEFRQRSPRAGDILHANLEIWKSAPQQPHVTNSQMQFRPDDSMLDMSGLLTHWMNTVSRVSSSPPTSYNGVLNPHTGQRSPGLLAGPADCPLTLSTLTAAASPTQTSLSPGSDFSNEDLPSDLEDEASDESCEVERCTTRPGSHSHIHLWQFLKELLAHSSYSTCIRWLDRTKGIFKIEDSVRVARLWGKRKNRPAMNYDKLSRSIRQYYKKGIMKKTERSQRLVYQFCHPYGQ